MEEEGYKLYGFWCYADTDGNTNEYYLYIKANKEKVEKLLDKFKEEYESENGNENYTISDFCGFLDEHKVKYKQLEPDYLLQFDDFQF
jgi:hypothetical protein